MSDNDRRFADLAMKAANQRTHQMIEIEALLVRLRRFEELEAAACDLLKTARVGYKIAIQARQDDGLVSEMVASCERMAALLEDA